MNTKWLLIILIACMALATRTLFLGFVNQVVFDEVHFGKFISSYCCTGERFFDIHPPVGKLIIAAGASVVGYTGDFSFNEIGQDYGSTPIGRIRMVPALVGSLLPLIIFVLLRQTGVSLSFSFLGAFATALDNALIVESRFIITDSILLSATFGAIACAFAAIRSKDPWHSLAWAVLAGVASGVAVGTKFTGLVSGALVGALFLYHAYKVSRREAGVWIVRLAAAIAAGIAVYLIGWMLHFSLLQMPGSGDVWGVPTGTFWTDLEKVHQQMVSANYNLTADHPYGSKWYTWPFMVRSVFYWQGSDNQFIYLLGNPVVWWGSFLLLCIAFVSLFIRVAAGARKLFQKIFSTGAWVFFLGYIVSFVPLMRVPRVLFLYHYLTPLLFSLLLGIWWLDTAVVPKNRKMVLSIVCICILVGFVIISPLTYGLSLSDFGYNLLFKISSWR